MSLRYALLLALPALLLPGCKDPPSQAGRVKDTGPVVDTDDTGPEPCTRELVESDPAQDEGGVYYRDPLHLIFSEEASELDIELHTAEGGFEPVQISWDEPGLNATISPLNPLEPSTDYVLTVPVCPDQDAAGIRFTTSSFGSPLTIPPDELIGRTFHLPLSEARYDEPAGLGTVIRNYLDQPILVGVMDANVDILSLMGAEGRIHGTTGDLVQNRDRPTWYFGSTSFMNRPFFSAYATAVPLVYEDTDIVFYDFRLDGTFSADGTGIGGARLSGRIDTRTLGPLFEAGTEPDAACGFLAGFGLECIACPDGQDLCLNLRASVSTMQVVDGLTLEPR